MNLLKETEEYLEECGKKPEDIIFIGSEQSGHTCSWEEFKVLADVHYDNGYGSQEVCNDLIIVFKDGSRLYRSEYDGSEWWSYMGVFKKPRQKLPLRQLLSLNYQRSLADANHDA